MLLTETEIQALRDTFERRLIRYVRLSADDDDRLDGMPELIHAIFYGLDPKAKDTFYAEYEGLMCERTEIW